MDVAGWKYLEVAYDTTDRAQVRLDGRAVDDGRDLAAVMHDLGVDGWEMVGSAGGAGTQHVLWFKRWAGSPGPSAEAGPASADVRYRVVLVSPGNSRFDQELRGRLMSALQELTGQSGWRVGRMLDKAPRVVVEGISRDDADRVQRTLEGLGATVEVS